MHAKEDQWAFQPIGDPFPDNPVKVMNEQNMYVALWYKHGKPIHGRSWNNGGVVECSFPYKDYELTGAKDLGGLIQVLQYKGDHNSLGYWYNWIKYADRLKKDVTDREIVHCGDSFPIFWPNSPEGPVLGYVDNKTEIARFSINKKVIRRQGGDLLPMFILARELKGGPPNCECAKCSKGPPCSVSRLLNEWADFRMGDPWPDKKLVKALDKSLDSLPGESPDQYVALWYQRGEPVMGRIWNDEGKIAANFGHGGNEYKKDVGSLQVLYELSDTLRGFDYDWVPFLEAASPDTKDWSPVFVSDENRKISPGVITVNGKQILGEVDIKNERCSYGTDGKENVIQGPAVHSTLVLCKRINPTKTANKNTTINTVRTISQTSQCNHQKFDSISFIKLILVTALVILVRCLEWILQKMILIYEKSPMIYNAARFCYEKPDLAMDLIRTSWHLAYVSYQSNLWTLGDAFDAFFGNSIGKMSDLGEKANEEAKRGRESLNSPTKSPSHPK